MRQPATGETPIPAATRVTHERPALERITMERAALQPHPRWRRFVTRVTQPRVLVAIGVVGAGCSAAARSSSRSSCCPTTRAREVRTLARSNPPTSRSPSSTAPRSTASPARSAPTSRRAVTRLGRDRPTPTPGYKKTVVLYADGQKPAAQKVAARPRRTRRSSRSTAHRATLGTRRRRGRDRRRGPGLALDRRGLA